MSSMYSLEVTQENGCKGLKFGGDLVINHIDKMTNEVREALASPSDVSVVVDNPSNIDMTFMQLVIAIKHSCQKAGKNFKVSATLKDDLKELVVKAGLQKEIGL